LFVKAHTYSTILKIPFQAKLTKSSSKYFLENQMAARFKVHEDEQIALCVCHSSPCPDKKTFL
jgi:hypothetical protein